jgi:hypothetical protein
MQGAGRREGINAQAKCTTAMEEIKTMNEKRARETRNIGRHTHTLFDDVMFRTQEAMQE